MNERKIRAALRQSSIGQYPASAQAMLAAIPPSIVSALTASQLAALLDANWHLAGTSKAIAEREAIEEGCIWDHSAGHMRDIAT